MKPVFDLTTGIQPSKSLTARLRSLLEEKFAQQATLKVQVNPEILAGAIITFKGYYFNFSLQKKLNEFFEKERKEIEKLLEINQNHETL